MKKKRVIVLSFVALLVLSALAVSYFTLPFRVFSEWRGEAVCDKENGVIKANGNSLKILQITDLHVNGALDMPITFSVIKRLLHKSEADMIVMTGDIFSNGCSEEDVKIFVDFMERVGLPWAAVLGNHDDETPYSMDELSSILEGAENSLFQKGDLTDLYGNYFYDVAFADGGRYKLIFMDSRSRGFTEESVEFYEDAVNASRAADGSVIESFLFFHIPLTETLAAIDDYENGRANGTGRIRETICDQDTDVNFFGTVLALGSTKALIYGHDHFNDAKTTYYGVDFNYGTKTGVSAGNQLGLVGGTLYTLQSDGDYSVKDIIVL